MNELLIPPVQLTLVVTNKCTAMCNNCCFQCSPNNNDRLTLDEVKQYIDKSIEAYNTIKMLIITGGECFTLGRELNQIIKYASSKGLLTRVVTNGYWAKSTEIAYKKLKKLVEDGLTEINFSTGDEHQAWIPYNNIMNGTISALEVNLTTVINVESSKLKKFSVKQILTDERLEKYRHLFGNKLIVLGGTWIPFLKSTKEEYDKIESEKDQFISCVQKAERCKILFSSISISPINNMITCCGLLVNYINYLHLGSVKKYSIKYLYEYQFQDFIKIWLFTEGPKKILDFCANKRNIPSYNTNKWHICQICAEIFRYNENVLILQKNYREVFSNVMFKYSLLRKKYLKLITKENTKL